MAPVLQRKIRQVSFLYIFVFLEACAASETLRYSVAEEMVSGSFVANIAKDLGLDETSLSSRKARIVVEGGREPFLLDLNSGTLVIKDNIDREELCGQVEQCVIHFELLLQNPLHFFRVQVEVSDINDHSPVFSEEEQILKIPESTNIGARFPLENAQDLDVGNNSLRVYTLSPTSDQFDLLTGEQSDGRKYAELVLAKSLDREEHPELHFLLTAVDGGSPPRSGTIKVHIIVLDANDNAPVFSQPLYRALVLENSSENTLVTTVSATDLDEGSHGDVFYSFSQSAGKVSRTFSIHPVTGEIRITKPLDFEMNEKYEFNVRATDGGGLSSHCKVLVNVGDVNDNSPEVVVTSLTSPLPEDALPGTVVALFNVRDRDSGDFGRTSCSIQNDIPFVLKPTFNNYFELITDAALDRESISNYNITITAVDLGSPSLTTLETIKVQISDINDNPPKFNQTSYRMHVTENNRPSLMIGSVNAVDSDSGSNAKVTYAILLGSEYSSPFISINSENGNLYVLKTFDYEEVKALQVTVQASDSGSPAKSSTVTVHVCIVDENDNAPVILYPLQNSSASYSDLVPRTAEAGYLVTKVVAVDGDSGQNSWLSYQLLQTTAPGLFTIVPHNGEVRTKRSVTERDAMKQQVVILVRDNGKPSQATRATLTILLVNGFSDVHVQVPDFSQEEKQDDPLTMYLVISLALISFLFLVSVTIFIVIKTCQRKQTKERYSPASGHFYDPSDFRNSLIDMGGTGRLSQSYQYEVCLTTGSGNSEFKFLKPIIPSLPVQHGNTELCADRNQDLQRTNQVEARKGMAQLK